MKCPNCDHGSLTAISPRNSLDDSIVELTEKELELALVRKFEIEWVCVKCGYSERR